MKENNDPVIIQEKRADIVKKLLQERYQKLQKNVGKKEEKDRRSNDSLSDSQLSKFEEARKAHEMNRDPNAVREDSDVGVRKRSSLIVANIPFETNHHDISELFHTYKPLNIDIVQNKITMQTPENCNWALVKLDSNMQAYYALMDLKGTEMKGMRLVIGNEVDF